MGESRVDMTTLGHMARGGGEGREGTRFSSQEAKDTKRAGNQTSGLYREEPQGEGQPRPWAREFRVEGMPAITCNRWGQRDAGRTWRRGLL